MIDEAEIHRMANSADVEERETAVVQIIDNFASFSYRDIVWADLHQLTQDEDDDVRMWAAHALGSAFSYVPDKDTAWADLHRLIQDENSEVRESAVHALGSAFSEVPDKDIAWADLYWLTQDEDYDVRWSAADVLGSVFSDVPDKDIAWADLHWLTQDEDSDERASAADVLGSAFSDIPDKDAAWVDLHRLTQDEDSDVRVSATHALGFAFSDIPDKGTAWADLHRLAQDENTFIRRSAARALGSAFSDLPDKDTAWADLHRLTQDEESIVRASAAHTFGSAFSDIPDKDTAWADLRRLTQDENVFVRRSAAYALGFAFSDVPDRDTAWADLHRLTQDENSSVRESTAHALGSAFSDIPDRDTAWADLHRLTQDENSSVRMYSYHSLGSASVYKATATENEEKFRDELTKAIDYFEQSSNESGNTYYNPAKFCLPFYRSYYAVISKKHEVEAETAKYLDEAKKATGRSESRQTLLKAVENLANAFKEAQKPLEFGEKKEHLRACKQYCDHTTELADSAREKSPVAAAAIMRGIPIVGVKIKEIIAEIQEKAKEACQQAKGTPTEEIACAVNREVQKWNISDQDGMTQNVENMIFCLKSLVPKPPLNNNLHEKIEEIRFEPDIMKQYAMFLMLIPLISTKSPRKSWTDIFDSSSTHGAFAGFLIAEFGMFFYPTSNTHLISAVVAVYVFFIVAILKNIKKE